MELPPEVQAISSKFQRRMVERDFKKDFLNDLAQLQFDFLLIDLIDERLNLHLGPNGTACTLSSELLSSGFQSASYGGATINSGSEQFWRLWETGWEILLKKLRGLGILDRLVVNQVFWSAQTEKGGTYEPQFQRKRIDVANQFLSRMYHRMGTDVPTKHFLKFDQELLTGSVTHRWGISPFHYIDAYYLNAIQRLTDL